MGDAEEWLTTLLAVEEVFPTSNSADAAVFAMVVLLVNLQNNIIPSTPTR
jgi:hypothetical protein